MPEIVLPPVHLQLRTGVFCWKLLYDSSRQVYASYPKHKFHNKVGPPVGICLEFPHRPRHLLSFFKTLSLFTHDLLSFLLEKSPEWVLYFQHLMFSGEGIHRRQCISMVMSFHGDEYPWWWVSMVMWGKRRMMVVEVGDEVDGEMVLKKELSA